VEADPSRTSKSRRLMDIISMLVGIYGSKELFVNEYRVMLAEKLLNKSDYDTDRDIRTLELLKVNKSILFFFCMVCCLSGREHHC
jgi:anaphase-promoting complex subunit 2